MKIKQSIFVYSILLFILSILLFLIKTDYFKNGKIESKPTEKVVHYHYNPDNVPPPSPQIKQSKFVKK